MNIQTWCEIERPIVGSIIHKTEQELKLNSMKLRDELFHATSKKEQTEIMWQIVKQACMFNLEDKDKPKFRELNERFS